MFDQYFMQTALSALFAGGLVAVFAAKKGKSPLKWFCLGAFFGLLALLALLYQTSLEKRAKKKIDSPQQATGLTIPAPFDKLWYYLDATHQQCGPMSHDALSRELQNGKISSATFVWHEEMNEWKRLSEITAGNP